jgi:hypothetical protein
MCNKFKKQMIMKNKRSTLLWIMASLLVLFVACNKEKDTPKPSISGTELGHGNSKLATAGKKLHVEASVLAPGKIDKIIVEIHHEEDDHKSGFSFLHEEWEFDSTYTKFSGLKNTTFHEDIDIPDTAETGHYHFHLKVIDQEGNVGEWEEEIEVLEPIE